MSVFFGGRKLVTPTTASVVNDDAMANRNLTVGNIVAFIGKSTGGKPNEVLRFGSPDQAKALLRSGELLDAVAGTLKTYINGTLDINQTGITQRIVENRVMYLGTISYGNPEMGVEYFRVKHAT